MQVVRLHEDQFNTVFAFSSVPSHDTERDPGCDFYLKIISLKLRNINFKNEPNSIIIDFEDLLFKDVTWFL